MSRNGFLATGVSLLAMLPMARGQTPPAPLPTPAAPLTAPTPAIPAPTAPVPAAELPATPPINLPLWTESPATPSADAASAPATKPYVGDIWTRSTLIGDLGGLRSRFDDAGITFEGNVTQYGFGLSGGVQRLPRIAILPLSLGDRTSYSGTGSYAFTFDLEKFGGLPHGKLLVRAQNWFGEYGNVSLSTGAFAPAVFPAALPPAPQDQGVPFITDIILTQPLSKELVVFVGKKNVIGAADQDDFAGGNGTTQFINQALIANPAFLLGLPYTSFTAGMASPREWGMISAFVYDPKDRTKDFFRVDDLFSTGVIVGTEVKVKTNFFDLPGEHHVGGLWKHVALTNLNFAEPPPSVYPEPVVPGFPTLNDSFTIYYGFDQYFQVYGKDTKKGWGMFGRASISDGNPTPVQYFLSLGLGGFSPFAYERGDKFGAGFFYVGASNEFGRIPRAVFGPTDGWGLELFYNWQMTPWMALTPDFQIVQPGAAAALANTSYIGGLRLNISF